MDQCGTVRRAIPTSNALPEKRFGGDVNKLLVPLALLVLLSAHAAPSKAVPIVSTLEPVGGDTAGSGSARMTSGKTPRKGRTDS